MSPLSEKRHSRQQGFSIVEMLVALLLSSLLGAGIVSVFVNNSYNFRLDEAVARMQDNARHALREVAYDLSMAGHYANLHIPTAVTLDGSLSIGVDCGPSAATNWMYRTTVPASDTSLSILAYDNANSGDLAAVHSCFAAGEVVPGTDVIAIKRVTGNDAATLDDGSVYLRTNGTVGLMYRAPFPTTPAINVSAPFDDWQFRPSIYFVRPFANVVGDGIPTLCRKTLAGSGPDMITECLATGIEDLQVEYGIDTTDDGNPNVYIPDPTVAELQSAVAARIFVLARTTNIDTRYTNTKTYSISNAPDYTPNDSFHRRVISTSVAIQNIRSMKMMVL